jgi:hypothetical protein
MEEIMIGQLFDASVRGAISNAASAVSDIAAGHGPGYASAQIAGVIPPGVSTTVTSFIASVPGTVIGFACKLNAVGCAAGETITVHLHKNATNLLNADVVIAAADVLNPKVGVLTLVGADLNYVAGDVVTIVAVQAGGAPPTADTLFASIATRNS